MAEILEKVLVEVMKAVGKGAAKRNKTIKNFGGKNYVRKC